MCASRSILSFELSESPTIPALSCVFAPRLLFRPPCEGRHRLVCVFALLALVFSCRVRLVRAGLGFGRHTGRAGAPLLLEGSPPARSHLRCPTETPEVLRSTVSLLFREFSCKRSPGLDFLGTGHRDFQRSEQGNCFVPDWLLGVV